MGFDDKLQQVTYERTNATRNQSWGHIASNSSRIVTFLDLCGHEKYLKTTMFGLVGLMPDYSMIVVGANMGVSRMTREHLGISLALGVPIFIVITKIDIAPKQVYEETLKTLVKIMESKNAGKQTNLIDDKSDVSICAKTMLSNKTCPIFSISNVNGEGIPKLKEFLSLLNSRVHHSGHFGAATDPVEFFIDGIYQVTGVGIVVTGTMLAGTVKPQQTLQLGPNKQGGFNPVQVKSIHCKRVEVEEAKAGQAVCFSIKSLVKKETLKRNHFRKGVILIDKDATPQPIFDFEAEVVILYNATTIKKNYQAVVHCGVIRQAAKVVDMSCHDGVSMRSGDKGIIKFRFMYRPEFLKEGTTVLFREGRTRGLGVVSRVIAPDKVSRAQAGINRVD
jgi:GTPase